MEQIIECVPNFSEGRNEQKIEQITNAIQSVQGIQVLNVDSGKAANRTVVTFVGSPKAVVEAAFQGIKIASEIIDMRHQLGKHPRIGATDVCPLIPIRGITMSEVVKYAHLLAKKVGDELGIPVYCYEFAAFKEERRNLFNCRFGEYEALKERITSDRWKPDFGPHTWSNKVAKSGVTVIGARNFLIAYNVNLNTKSIKLANKIAADIRESGKLVKPVDTKTLVRVPGTLKSTKAIGWYIDEYGFAQVSMNITDISVTPIYKAYEEVCIKAKELGVKVIGSELIGLIPLQAILDAGKYFLEKESLSADISEEEIIMVAVKALGLDSLRPFEPKKRIVDYLVN